MWRANPEPTQQSPGPTSSFSEYQLGQSTRSANALPAIVDTSLLENGAMSAATQKYVDLSWPSMAAGTTFSIVRDGLILASVSGTSYRDKTIAAGTDYQYQIVSDNPNRITDSGTVSSDDVTPSPTTPQTAASFGLAVHTPLDSGKDGVSQTVDSLNTAIGMSNAASSSSRKNDARVTTRAFIPQKSVDLPPTVGWGCGNYSKFSGDNRGFTGTEHASSRIQEDATLFWGKPVYHNTTIGVTHALNANGSIAATRTAKTAGTGTYYWGGTSSKVTIKSTLDGGNPFCALGAIHGDVTITIHKNGSFSASGSHRLMPHWEIYFVYWNGSSWRQWEVWTHTLRSPICLIDHTPFCAISWDNAR